MFSSSAPSEKPSLTGIHEKSLFDQAAVDRRQDRRAKDGDSGRSLGIARTVVPVERVVGGRVARTPSLAAAGVVGRHAVRRRPAHRHDLAARRRRQRRLPGLLLLPGRRGTQERIDCHAVGQLAVGDAFRDLCADRSRDSRGARQGRAWLVRFLLQPTPTPAWSKSSKRSPTAPRSSKVFTT